MGRTRGDLLRPAVGWFALLDGGVVVLTTLALSPSAYGAASRRLPLPPRPALQGLLAATVAIHAAEATHAYRRSREGGSPVPGRWALQTLAVGFPSLLALRRSLALPAVAPGYNAG